MSQLFRSVFTIKEIESYSQRNTAIHRLHPIAKMTVTLLYIILVISFNKYQISGLIPFFFYPVFVISVFEIPLNIIVPRVNLALIIAFLAGVSNLFFNQQTAFAVFRIPISFGLLSFASILIKTVLCVISAVLFIATTKMQDLLNSLSKLRIPKILIMQIILTYRYLGVLMKEASQMYQAYSLRANGQKGILLKDAGNFLGSLLIRSYQKAKNVYISMKLRGFDRYFTLGAYKKFRICDFLFLFLLGALFIGLRVFNLSKWLADVLAGSLNLY